MDISEKRKILDDLKQIYKPMFASVNQSLSEERELLEAIEKVKKSTKSLLKDGKLEQIGDKNSEKISVMIEKLQEKLSSNKTTQQKSDIIEQDLKNMIEFVEKVEEKSGKDKIARVKKVLTTALVVIVTAGLSKSAKEKFAEAKSMMSNKSASKINKNSSQVVADLKKIPSNSRSKANSYSR